MTGNGEIRRSRHLLNCSFEWLLLSVLEVEDVATHPGATYPGKARRDYCRSTAPFWLLTKGSRLWLFRPEYFHVLYTKIAAPLRL